MSTITDTLDTPLADVRLLNARRYGLTEENLSQFTQMMSTFRDKNAPAADAENEDVGERSSTDLIKDYVRQRITDRLSNTDKSFGVYGDYSQDMPFNPQDLIFDMVGTPRKQSNDLSGLLNMHFDLNTLQMFA